MSDPWPSFGEATPGYGLEDDGQLVLDLDGFDGPIDLLLTLARNQKVDLSRISILELADQYLAYVEQVRRIRLELAADYLVMAAWLAYLKSRLLLPVTATADDEPDGDMLADALGFQLRRLEGFRQAAAALFARPQLGQDVFARGAPEATTVVLRAERRDRLYDLLAAYGAFERRRHVQDYAPRPLVMETVEQAVSRIRRMLGAIPGWAMLNSFIVQTAGGSELQDRSALAATFGATLELAKRGLIELRQDGTFAPIYLRPTGQAERNEDDAHDQP